LGVRIWLLVPGHDGALHRVCDCLLFGGRPTAAACPASVDQRDSAPRLTLDAVLAAYLSGDVDVVSRSFGRSSDFQIGCGSTTRVSSTAGSDPGIAERRSS
jgi:hypothetical protein